MALDLDLKFQLRRALARAAVLEILAEGERDLKLRWRGVAMALMENGNGKPESERRGGRGG